MDQPVLITALDLYAGTGWGVAARTLGITEIGVENNRDAMDTRMANGLSYGYWNVLDGLDGNLTYGMPEYNMLIASPPCQEYSLAGNGRARELIEHTISLIHQRTKLDTDLVTVPLAYILRDQPTYVVMEQVPPVLPVWEAYATVLRAEGYLVWVGVLNAAEHGVAQTRKRAILMARRDGVQPTPPPTQPRVTIADVLPHRAGQTMTSRVRNKKETVRRSDQQSATITSKAYSMEWSDGTRVSIEEAAALQSYPEGFEWVGDRTWKFLQIGNAVPPRFAEALLKTFTHE